MGQLILEFLASKAKVSAASHAMLIRETLPGYSQKVAKGIREAHLAACYGL